MGETKSSQKHVREELDRKLQLSSPSRELLEELAIACAKNPTSTDATFQYAFALSKSTERSELRYAVQILDGLIKDGYSHQVDCMYGAATALYLLGDYQHSRTRCEAILRSNPTSARFVNELHLASIAADEQEQEMKAKKAAAIGVGVAATVGIAAAVAGLLMSKK